jgi:hypothetical protein
MYPGQTWHDQLTRGSELPVTASLIGLNSPVFLLSIRELADLAKRRMKPEKGSMYLAFLDVNDDLRYYCKRAHNNPQANTTLEQSRVQQIDVTYHILLIQVSQSMWKRMKSRRGD